MYHLPYIYLHNKPYHTIEQQSVHPKQCHN